ncbi:hypothetical protein [Paraburkholderia gardini]|uniref:hypothetical protein n=1 Tax=Paraburkholderia gardini TaxID=2823469 RepID=UPI001E3DDDFC|nr:hypothetical protein [Paraburkholderia gardini]
MYNADTPGDGSTLLNRRVDTLLKRGDSIRGLIRMFTTDNDVAHGSLPDLSKSIPIHPFQNSLFGAGPICTPVTIAAFGHRYAQIAVEALVPESTKHPVRKLQ